MELSCSTTIAGGVTFVSLRASNPHDEPARFRISNQLAGPVWPPRRGGQPEAGWDSDGFEGVLEPGEEVALGYATPAAPSSQPAELAWVEPAEDLDPSPDSGAVLRAFADGRPPRSVLSPTPSIARSERSIPSSDPDMAGGWP